MNKELIIVAVIAVLGAFGVYQKIGNVAKKIILQLPAAVSATLTILFTFVEIAVMAGVMIISSAYLATLSYSPFIYFRF